LNIDYRPDRKIKTLLRRSAKDRISAADFTLTIRPAAVAAGDCLLAIRPAAVYAATAVPKRRMKWVAVVLLMLLQGFGKTSSSGQTDSRKCVEYTYNNVVKATDSNHLPASDPAPGSDGQSIRGPAKNALPISLHYYLYDRCWISPLHKPEWIKLHFKGEVSVSAIGFGNCECTFEKTRPECSIKSLPSKFCVFGLKKSGERKELKCVGAVEIAEEVNGPLNGRLEFQLKREKFTEIEIKVEKTHSEIVTIGYLGICR